MIRSALVAALAAVGALAPLGAYAQPKEALSYRCVGKDKKTYYGQTLPPQCVGQAVEMLNAQGTVVRRIDPQADADTKAKKEAEEAKRREEETARREQRRRDSALLATYTSEPDIESARKRALVDNEQAVKDLDQRIAALKKRQGETGKEMEFYKGKNKPPAKLLQDVQDLQIDLKAQEGLREAKQKEVDAINARYDDDKRRYIEVTRGTAAKK